MTPTAAGRHCAACATEVVDFTRLSEAEILEFMTARKGQRVCAFMLAPPITPHHPRRVGKLRGWLLAVAAFLSGQHVSALGVPPAPLPIRVAVSEQTAPPATIVIRGTVLDDSLNVPVRGAYVFIGNTKYGAITNEQGEFELTFARGWKVLEKQPLVLRISAGYFAFKPQQIPLDINRPPTAILVVRLMPTPGLMGKIARTNPPVRPPRPRKSSQ